jgi:hypothetical protein
VDRDSVMRYLAALTDEEFQEITAEARGQIVTLDERIQAALDRGDTKSAVALQQQKHITPGASYRDVQESIVRKSALAQALTRPRANGGRPATAN